MPHLARLGLASIFVFCLGLASPAAAFTDLTLGRKLVARDRDNPTADKITFRYVNDPALQNLPESPLCPTETRLRFLTDAGALPEETLDCNLWEISGSGYKYKEKVPGGTLRKITYRPGRLIVTVKGPPYGDAPVAGPVGFVETRVQVGGTEYCGRWSAPSSLFKKNAADRIVAFGPTAACEVECGNAVTESGEECDDGNAIDGDGCDTNCTATACGNGIETAGEACDDGNGVTGDGCRPDCTQEVCGDGILDAPLEACDDGNVVGGDCCSAACAFEEGGSSCADDGNVCSDDVCDGSGTCTHPGNSGPCDDMTSCTIGDQCDPGTATCGGDLRPPWINELDYDDFAGPGPLDDRDEFIEIAGVAGSDLSGYQIVSVEGAPTTGCFTPPTAPQALPGEAHFVGTLPAGSILLDDTGTGIGFLVVCLTNTSSNVVNLPACDVVLAAPRTDSNLPNGHLLNGDEVSCPDGILLLDDLGFFVDAVGYEGIVPAVGTYGPFFHVFPAYSAPRDEGWLAGVSIQKTTSTLERAQDASEWEDPSETVDCVNQGGGSPPPPGCVEFTWTPAAENIGQTLSCSPSGAFVDGAAFGLW